VRAFVAIDVGAPFEGSPSRREDGAPSHLTLRFLGEVADDRLPQIVDSLRAVAGRTTPFDLTLEGVGAFPSRHDPRVVWVGVTTGSVEVVRLSLGVSEALVALGFPPEPHDVVPHVTLFRVRSSEGRRRARALLDGEAPPPPAHTTHVSEIALKESTFTTAGPRHHTRERFALGGRGSVTP
jgi:2'-5' RNA ligase